MLKKLPYRQGQLKRSDIKKAVKAVERDLKLGDLEKADELFITSTTRDLLPVIEVEGIRVKTGHAVRDGLQAAFTQYVSNYVAAHSRKLASVQ